MVARGRHRRSARHLRTHPAQGRAEAHPQGPASTGSADHRDLQDLRGRRRCRRGRAAPSPGGSRPRQDQLLDVGQPRRHPHRTVHPPRGTGHHAQDRPRRPRRTPPERRHRQRRHRRARRRGIRPVLPAAARACLRRVGRAAARGPAALQRRRQRRRHRQPRPEHADGRPQGRRTLRRHPDLRRAGPPARVYRPARAHGPQRQVTASGPRIGEPVLQPVIETSDGTPGRWLHRTRLRPRREMVRSAPPHALLPLRHHRHPRRRTPVHLPPSSRPRPGLDRPHQPRRRPRRVETTRRHHLATQSPLATLTRPPRDLPLVE
ncbi:hypothetical protein QE370_001676 [Aeromicrobium sp. SORGH_AS981]|nr:hypothetical protein [Aeromicrobium sp. SORGH_AS_0981]